MGINGSDNVNNSGVNNFDWNTISTLISDLSAYEAHDGELSAFSEVKTELDKFNANHENFLDKVTEQLDPKIAGTIANDYLEGNSKEFKCHLISAIHKLQSVINSAQINYNIAYTEYKNKG